jgi:ABC-type multidrug transport system fused ATPase/permease subunit
MDRLQRFYEIQEGQILVDGVDIKTLSPQFLRSKISSVPQGPILFSLSIIDNICFARLTATEQEVSDSARIANAHDFIMELPDAYNTVVKFTSNKFIWRSKATNLYWSSYSGKCTDSVAC